MHPWRQGAPTIAGRYHVVPPELLSRDEPSDSTRTLAFHRAEEFERRVAVAEERGTRFLRC